MIATGLWRIEGVPHKGWTCFDVEDLEDDLMTCEMCQVAEVRYVHHMNHPQYETLRVGCICAEHMSEGYDAKQAEQRARRSARRRASWKTADWRESRAGNSVYYRTRDGYVVIVFWAEGSYDPDYRFVVKTTDEEVEETSKDDYPTLDRAKEAAFRVLEELREEAEDREDFEQGEWTPPPFLLEVDADKLPELLAQVEIEEDHEYYVELDNEEEELEVKSEPYYPWLSDDYVPEEID